MENTQLKFWINISLKLILLDEKVLKNKESSLRKKIFPFVTQCHLALLNLKNTVMAFFKTNSARGQYLRSHPIMMV